MQKYVIQIQFKNNPSTTETIMANTLQAAAMLIAQKYGPIVTSVNLLRLE